MNQERSAHRIPGLANVLVDGFRHKLDAVDDWTQRLFFLTHWHSDHYSGLYASWSYGRIICTPVTAKLLERVMKINPKYITTVNINEAIDIGHAKVTFLDANHCPGAALLLFEVVVDNPSSSSSSSLGPKGTSVPSTITYLHTGDMRYHERFQSYPALTRVRGCIDQVFLDTTYAHPKHVFASQKESIATIVHMSTTFLQAHPDGLILCGAYNIGKERIVCALQDKLGVKVYMTEEKMKMMSCLGAELDIEKRISDGMFTTDPQAARVHICSMGFAGSMMPFFRPNFDNVEQLRQELNEEQKPSSSDGDSADKGSTSFIDGSEGIDGSKNGGRVGGRGGGILGRPVGAVLAFIPTGWAAKTGTKNQSNGTINNSNSISNSSSNTITTSTNATAPFSKEEDDDGEEVQFSPHGGLGPSRHHNGITVQLIAYSEHSQCQELIDFVTFLKPREIVPTVYNDDKDRHRILDLFRRCVDHKANKRAFFDKYFSQTRKQSTASLGGTTLPTMVGNTGSSSSSSSNRTGVIGGGPSTVADKKTTVQSNSSGTVIGGNASVKRTRRENNNTTSTTKSDTSVAPAAVNSGEWTCLACTFVHRSEQDMLFLTCALCGSSRAY